MPPRTLLLSLLGLCLVAAGPFGRRKPAEEAETETETEAPKPKPPRVEIPPDLDEVWALELPFSVGETPVGLGSLSAQSCAACHVGAHESWAAGAHGGAASAEPWATLARESADPACSTCHLPLIEQRDTAGGAPNPRFSATLATEGVTCASCHVRDGAVIVGRPGVEAPHPVAWTPQLGESTFCASCHQLDFRGADQPLYDTFGEWQRSAQGQAGVSCQDCHTGPGTSSLALASHHGPAARTGQGLTALLEVPTTAITRGGEALVGAIRLQNAGAGHHIPTGSPFTGLRVLARVEIAAEEEVWRSEPVRADLARSLDPQPPYATIADTRLAAGEERAIPLALSVPLDAPAGEASLVLEIVRTLRGEPTGEVVQQQRLPLRMD